MHSSFRRGFTLIEILVVMSIIAVLLTLALPRYFASVDKSKDVALREDLKVMRTTIDRFYADKGRYPEGLAELVAQHYMQSVPVDPISGSAETWILVPSSESNVPGIVDVKSGAQGQTANGVPYGQL